MKASIDTNKKQILTSCLNIIAGISDKEYQKRVWIRGEGPEVDDFDETACNFFQDGNGIILKHKDFEITDKQYHLLVKLRDEFDAFCNGTGLEHYLPEIFIDTPEWTKITELAKEIIKVFGYHSKEIT
jgi:hypothetical protein